MTVKVYVAGPMTMGDFMGNVRAAINAANRLRRLGYLPYVPHLSVLWHLVHPRPYEDWLDQDFEWVAACNALLRLPGESSGADREVAHAQANGIPVFDNLAALHRHFLGVAAQG